MPGPASPSPGSACAPSLAFSPSSLLSSLLPLHLLLPPLLSPLPSSIFSFPLPPLPGPSSPLPPVLPPCAQGAPPFWVSWGPLPEVGEGALWTALSPRPSHTAQRQSVSPLSFLGPRGSPALRPTRIRECLQDGGWAGAGPGSWKAGLTAAWWGAPAFPCSPERQIPSPTRGLPCALHLPASFPLGLSSPLPLGTQLILPPSPQLLGS